MKPIPFNLLILNVLVLCLTPAHAEDGAKVDEVLAFACARDVATEVDNDTSPGPLFFRPNLVFTSIATAAPLLIVNGGAGIFSVPLEHSGVNRIRFRLPTNQGAEPETYFLSYLHDPEMRSRVFDFAEHRIPAGKSELDYEFVRARRAPEMLPQLEYAIWQTSAAALGQARQGSLHGRPIKADCDYLARKSGALSRSLNFNLATLDQLLSAPARIPAQSASRYPASTRPGP